MSAALVSGGSTARGQHLPEAAVAPRILRDELAHGRQAAVAVDHDPVEPDQQRLGLPALALQLRVDRPQRVAGFADEQAVQQGLDLGGLPALPQGCERRAFPHDLLLELGRQAPVVDPVDQRLLGHPHHREIAIAALEQHRVGADRRVALRADRLDSGVAGHHGGSGTSGHGAPDVGTEG
jgi:hypothetical protein